MMKLAFVTDSGTGFSQAFWKERGIYSLPLQITVGDHTYDEFEEISYDQVIDNLHKQTLMKTSLPSLGKIEDLFEQLKKDGYEGVFAVPICKGLSGTLDAMESAARQVGLTFYGFDTYSTAVLQSHCILTAKKMYEEGKSIEEIFEELEKIAGSCDTILLVDDLQHMRRGGRLTATAAALGGLLKIKPILKVSKDTGGKVDSFDKVRTLHKAVACGVSQVGKALLDGVDYEFFILNGAADQMAVSTKEMMEALRPGTPVHTLDMFPVIACHTGLGSIGVQYIPKIEGVTYDETRICD